MTQFKKGDRVRRKDGDTFSNARHVVTVDKVCVRGNALYGRGEVWFVETGTQLEPDKLELAEDTSKHHKHHDLIIAWAKGAVIEYLGGGGVWYWASVPVWAVTRKYRIKPDVPKETKEQKEIKRIEEEIRVLADDLGKLKENK